MNDYKCEIPIKTPSLNEYIRVCRCNKYQANKFKNDYQRDIGLFLLTMPKWTKPIVIHFTWIEGNKKRDFDNVSSMGHKLILDTMVSKGKLVDDNRNYVVGFTDTFEYGKEFKVIIEIEEAE